MNTLIKLIEKDNTCLFYCSKCFNKKITEHSERLSTLLSFFITQKTRLTCEYYLMAIALTSKNLKKRRMRILSARIFLSFLAGKLKKFEHRLPDKHVLAFMTIFTKTSFNKQTQ